MYYHASSVKGITQLTPQSSNHGIPVDISGVEFIPDAYEAILQAEREGLLTIIRYEEMNDKKRAWIEKTILAEYENASDHPEYRHFLKGNFSEILCGR